MCISCKVGMVPLFINNVCCSYDPYLIVGINCILYQKFTTFECRFESFRDGQKVNSTLGGGKRPLRTVLSTDPVSILVSNYSYCTVEDTVYEPYRIKELKMFCCMQITKAKSSVWLLLDLFMYEPIGHFCSNKNLTLSNCV